MVGLERGERRERVLGGVIRPGPARWGRRPLRQVPLARRNLLAQPRRLAASAIGVGLAVMLILLLDGLWAGLRTGAKVYATHARADLFVLQPGVRDLTAGIGSLRLTTLAAVRAEPGVAWATPVRTAYMVLDLSGRKVVVYMVGSVPGQAGGPWAMVSGRAPAADDDIAVDTVLARRYGLHVGGLLEVANTTFRIVGLTHGIGYMFSYLFVTHAALDRLTGASAATTTMILAGAANPNGAAAALRAGGFNALTRSQVATNDVRFATGIFGSPIRLMVGIGLAAGTLIIALTAYTAVIERRREYGIVKALGATRRRLVGLALAQTFSLAGLGLAAGIVLFAAGRALIAATRPQFAVLLTASAMGRAAVAALIMALLAAVIPARRLADVEPAAAYRSAP